MEEEGRWTKIRDLMGGEMRWPMAATMPVGVIVVEIGVSGDCLEISGCDWSVGPICEHLLSTVGPRQRKEQERSSEVLGHAAPLCTRTPYSTPGWVGPGVGLEVVVHAGKLKLRLRCTTPVPCSFSSTCMALAAQTIRNLMMG